MSNYQINYKLQPDVEIDENRLMPFHSLSVEVRVFEDAQHDGRLWHDDDIDCQEYCLRQEILGELAGAIDQLIKKCKPFAIHGHFKINSTES